MVGCAGASIAPGEELSSPPAVGAEAAKPGLVEPSQVPSPNPAVDSGAPAEALAQQADNLEDGRPVRPASIPSVEKAGEKSEPASPAPTVAQPLAALMYLWFGFDLDTGNSIGGLKSSHWNTDLGIGSRVGVTDEPAYGFYASDDPAVIGQQLASMEEAGIGTIIVSWHGWGDINFDGNVDDKEKEAMQRALIALMDYISSTNAPFKVAVLVEPFMVDPPGLTLVQKQQILDFLWDNVYNVYPAFMFDWETNPLLVTWSNVDLKEPADGRFTVKSWSSTDNPNWKADTSLDWNWYPDVTLVEGTISDDGVIVLFPRFDEYWMYIMGKDLGHDYRRVDPLLEDQIYGQAWQVAVDNKDDISLILLYTWNEHEEHAAIEPDKGISPVSYGNSLIEKTSRYYRQFLAGQNIVNPSPGTSRIR